VGVGLTLAPRLADGSDPARLLTGCPSQLFGVLRPPREGFLTHVDGGVGVSIAGPGTREATEHRLAFTVPLARVPTLVATLTGVGGRHLNERHSRQIGFVLDTLGEFAERGILQYPVESPLLRGPSAFAAPGHAVQGQFLDADEIVPAYELGTELVREIRTHPHLFSRHVRGAALCAW